MTTPRRSSPRGSSSTRSSPSTADCSTTCSAVKRSFHRVHVSFDEWNVWYREMDTRWGFQEAPHLLEETYNLQDALVCAQYLHAFLRHADVVKVACLAQIVNVIAPILTRSDGLLVQSIYWPFRMLRDAAAGDALRVAVRAPDMKTTRRGDVPSSTSPPPSTNRPATASVSLVNRDAEKPVDVQLRIADRAMNVTSATVLHAHPKAQNDWDSPDTVAPTDLSVITARRRHTAVPAAGTRTCRAATEEPRNGRRPQWRRSPPLTGAMGPTKCTSEHDRSWKHHEPARPRASSRAQQVISRRHSRATRRESSVVSPVTAAPPGQLARGAGPYRRAARPA